MVLYTFTQLHRTYVSHSKPLAVDTVGSYELDHLPNIIKCVYIYTLIIHTSNTNDPQFSMITYNNVPDLPYVPHKYYIY